MTPRLQVVAALCTVAFALNLLDLLTTILGLQMGFTEGGIGASTMIASGSFFLFTFVKAIYAIGIVGAFLWIRGVQSKISLGTVAAACVILVILSLYFGLTVANNFNLILHH